MAGIEPLGGELTAGPRRPPGRVFVPIGGGGLLVATARWAGRAGGGTSTHVHGVQPLGNDTVVSALRAGEDRAREVPSAGHPHLRPGGAPRSGRHGRLARHPGQRGGGAPGVGDPWCGKCRGTWRARKGCGSSRPARRPSPDCGARCRRDRSGRTSRWSASSPDTDSRGRAGRRVRRGAGRGAGGGRGRDRRRPPGAPRRRSDGRPRVTVEWPAPGAKAEAALPVPGGADGPPTSVPLLLARGRRDGRWWSSWAEYTGTSMRASSRREPSLPGSTRRRCGDGCWWRRWPIPPRSRPGRAPRRVLADAGALPPGQLAAPPSAPRLLLESGGDTDQAVPVRQDGRAAEPESSCCSTWSAGEPLGDDAGHPGARARETVVAPGCGRVVMARRTARVEGRGRRLPARARGPRVAGADRYPATPWRSRSGKQAQGLVDLALVHVGRPGEHVVEGHDPAQASRPRTGRRSGRRRPGPPRRSPRAPPVRMHSPSSWYSRAIRRASVSGKAKVVGPDALAAEELGRGGERR